MQGDQEGRLLFESRELLRNAGKELSVLRLSMKEENLCAQIVPIMSDSLSGLNLSCVFLSMGEIYVAEGF